MVASLLLRDNKIELNCLTTTMKKELTFEESLSGLLGCGSPNSFRLGFFRLICSFNTES
jgi:hypothetical protein